ncbi:MULTISPECIES: non-ribosomal peptide synthetase [unclassified Nocardia]|uniref:non-ribosomal peptide synthetase n=1 Tax=unclassified Nocardia TaxID=2637762 RepID=UPI001CE428FF|nr:MULTISPECIES: non-ribosomal peptide synthetase [unclassified Nocardia]
MDRGEPVDLLDRFQAVASRHPDRIAVRDTETAVSFAELDRASARLAATLAQHGIERVDRVGVCLPRSVRLVVALLAVWRAGGVYVPLDPDYPADRLAFMAADAGIRALVAEQEPGWNPDGVPVVPAVVPEDVPGAFVNRIVLPAQPAYLIYTSGSTGRPKGVQATRGAVASLVTAMELAEIYAAEPRVVAWNASVSFDASVQQWVRVCRGDQVVVLTDDHRRDPARLAAWLDECAVTDLDLTPSHWEALRDYVIAEKTDGRTLRLFIGGEPITRHRWTEIATAVAAGRIEALNLYGPTECTVDATAAWIMGDRPNIGDALPANRLYILDDVLSPVPDGATGELYIAGPRLANGYHGRPDSTAGAFVADPFSPTNDRMYRTGDRVSRSADGFLEFHGRTDRQVKLHGYRLELGEIEAVVRAHPSVTSAAVIVRADTVTGDQLIAYYVTAVSGGPTVDELRRHVAATLPDFMVPSGFVEIEALPLTPNGKLDEDALPNPHTMQDTVDINGRAPSGKFEELIAEVWSEVLGQKTVSAVDDFFALGGHSLIALRVVARVKKNLGISISANEVYRHPRLSDLAQYVEARYAEFVAAD